MKSEMRHKLAQLPFEEKIRKVGELIRLRQKIKADAGQGVPIERVREDIDRWTTSPKNSKK